MEGENSKSRKVLLEAVKLFPVYPLRKALEYVSRVDFHFRGGWFPSNCGVNLVLLILLVCLSFSVREYFVTHDRLHDEIVRQLLGMDKSERSG